MAVSTLRSRIRVLPSNPTSEAMSIRNLMGDFGGLVELRPVYQRQIRWKKENMCALISTIMTQGLVPGLILYRLQEDQRMADLAYRLEMVDGQHRFFVIQKFFNSEKVTEAGSKPFMITWVYRDAESGRDIHIFFKRTADTEAWEAENRGTRFEYMTEEEQDFFKSYKIDVKEIKDRLTLDQRRAIFVSLQQGISVRGSDLLKNKVEVPLVRFITEKMRWETKMKQALEDHCWMNPKNYWLHWVIRFHLILNVPLDSTKEDQFVIRDSQITKDIKDEKAFLTTTEEQEQTLKSAVERFFSFLESIPKSVKLSPCHFYALFTHLTDASEGREDVIRGHINEWANKTSTKAWKKGWENRRHGDDDEERACFFSSILEEISAIKAPARAPEVRKSIPKKLREMLWVNHFGESTEGACFCCGGVLTKAENFHACHLVAHKHGGDDRLTNLRPGCRDCNLSMGTQDMREYKRQFYPDVRTPLCDE